MDDTSEHGTDAHFHWWRLVGTGEKATHALREKPTTTFATNVDSIRMVARTAAKYKFQAVRLHHNLSSFFLLVQCIATLSADIYTENFHCNLIVHYNKLEMYMSCGRIIAVELESAFVSFN